MGDPIDQAALRPWPENTPGLRLGDLRIDLLRRRIERPDGHAELPHRMFELLLVFLAEPDVLHTRSRLFERVWSGVVVEDANLSQSVWMLRKALGPERKHWIRTVAKSGYVFEPPASLEQEACTNARHVPVPSSDPTRGRRGVAGQDSAPESRPSAEKPTPSATVGAVRLTWGFGMAAALALALGLFLLNQPTSTGASFQLPLAVTLIEVGDSAAEADTGWPGKLLHAWLGWKLAHLPDALLVSEAHLAADSTTLSPTVVLLSSGRSPAAPDEFFVRAHITPGMDGESIELRGTQAQVPALVDALSRQVIERLLPDRSDLPWPELAIDVDTARRYGDAYDALNARDWSAAAGAMHEVVRQAPGFGLARFQLAIAQAHLGQGVGAMEQMAAARDRLSPVPADAESVLDARSLAIDPQQHGAAADAYGRLSAALPQQSRFKLKQAHHLVQAGRVDEAMVILSDPIWERQHTAWRISRQLILAQAGMASDDYERARADAAIAEQMALAAGPGWTQERARALLMMATADTILGRESAEPPLYELAAQQFDSAGNSVSAALARFQAAAARDPGNVEGPQLEVLLAEAHAGGHHNLEVLILRQVAFNHAMAGRQEQFRQRLEQALATAAASGDRYRQELLHLDLLREDILQGRFSSAEQRVERLREGVLEGDPAAWVLQYDADLRRLRGDGGTAMEKLQETLQSGSRALPPTSEARLACALAELMIEQGRLATARMQLARCGDHAGPELGRVVETIGASADLFAGNRTAALSRIHALQAATNPGPENPDGWPLRIGQAYLLSRSGELDLSSQLYEQTLPLVQRAGYRWLEAQILTGLAEVAAARGDWSESRRRLAEAQQVTPEGVWVLERRIEMLDIVLAMAEGQEELVRVGLSELDARAHRFGDAMTLLKVHGLLSPELMPEGCDRRSHAALLARTGLRGVNLDWLTASVPTPPGPQDRRR